MIDLGNFEEAGQYTLIGQCDTALFMEKWMSTFKLMCDNRNLSVFIQKDIFKVPNMARELGGMIGLIGKVVSKTYDGYCIFDSNNQNASQFNKKKSLYAIYLVPNEIEGNLVINIYLALWYNIMDRNRKALGATLFDAAGQILDASWHAITQ